jgi:hypothetical protein
MVRPMNVLARERRTSTGTAGVPYPRADRPPVVAFIGRCLDLELGWRRQPSDDPRFSRENDFGVELAIRALPNAALVGPFGPMTWGDALLNLMEFR